MADKEETGKEAASNDKGSNELVTAVDQLLNELGPKFSRISTELFERMDEMSRRLDDMEAAIQAGNDTRSGDA